MSAPRVSRVILASAGSGKTWQLSRAYLALLADGASPSSLLATTFTRKAAGEILQRVLAQLLEAAEAPAESAPSNARLASAAPPAAPDVAAAQSLLGRFARDLPHCRVQTLDSFFVRLAGRFGQELGLPPGWRLGSEPELTALRARAVSRALQDAAPRELAELLRQVQRDGAGRRVHEALLDVVLEGHELLLDSAPGAWAPIATPARLDAERIEAGAALLDDAEVPLTGKGKPNANWLKARRAAAEAVRGGDWEGLLAKGLGGALLAGGGYHKQDLLPAMRAALAPLVEHARGVLLADLMAAGRALRNLLERYDAALAACQRASGCYGFADLPRLLHGTLALDGEVTALRDEGRLQHLLLDEFQDTSVSQWRVLAPLIAACLAARDGSRSLFCVGDVKQSIYGWRQGEPELLVDLSRRPGVAAETLDLSRRSSPVVLAAVNRVFTGLPSRAIFASDSAHDRDALRAAADNWTRLFREHRAHDEQLAGCFSLREVPADGDARLRRRAVLDAACTHIAALAARAPEARIGVLVRGRAAIAPLILGLRARGVHACGEGGNQLTDSAAVLLALSLLTLADHPDDTAAAFHVASSPLADALGIRGAAACEPALGREAGRAHRPAAAPRLAAAAALRERLQRDGYGVVLADWSRRVGSTAAFSAWDRARFAQLVDLGFSHEGGRGGLRASDFVALVRERRVEDPGSAPVRVLTVHGAKGLEYDAVVLPDLDYELPRWSSRAPKFLASRRGPDGSEDAAGPLTVVVRHVPKELRTLHPLLGELAAREQRRTMEEQLSVLYVALTRAKVRLDLFIEARREGARQPSCRFGELLRECFNAPDAAAPGSDGVLYSDGDENAAWPDRRGAAHAAVSGMGASVARAVASADALPLFNAFAPAARRLPRSRSPSAGAHAVLRTAREMLAAPPRAALEYGLLLHRFCQEIAWLDGDPERPAGVPLRESLLAGARELVASRGLQLDEAALQAGLAAFDALLRTPAARAVFHRPARGPDGIPAHAIPDLWRERRFAVAVSEGELLRGAFDRVVIWRADGRAMAGEIIDFKSDAPPSSGAGGVKSAAGLPADARALDEWLDERVARYTPQLQDYRSALARLIDLPPARIACRLLFLQADAARDVPADA